VHDALTEWNARETTSAAQRHGERERERGREAVVAVCIIVGVNGKPISTNAVYRVVMSVQYQMFTLPEHIKLYTKYTSHSMHAACIIILYYYHQIMPIFNLLMLISDVAISMNI
jgi:hypothetical protein